MAQSLALELEERLKPLVEFVTPYFFYLLYTCVRAVVSGCVHAYL